jgi:hypothetical protein
LKIGVYTEGAIFCFFHFLFRLFCENTEGSP